MSARLIEVAAERVGRLEESRAANGRQYNAIRALIAEIDPEGEAAECYFSALPRADQLLDHNAGLALWEAHQRAAAARRVLRYLEALQAREAYERELADLIDAAPLAVAVDAEPVVDAPPADLPETLGVHVLARATRSLAPPRVLVA